ncbi:type III ribulose-bisphosphate carboxylase [Candidatus Borrarchaeum sp.]|uniref:type III ribulose-bisphosphate carboxylase n=1 Tax=Candidatus Borrarchaeum sp. TaxID=2846742 RepID=UPI00257D7F6D|nr:type III ribulose-bisphosphate carboxylase [Candidatus Borrarchaeum sp.]
MPEKIEWYLEFVDYDYRPSKTDLIVTFYVEPAKGMSFEEVAGRVASESSVGTWTTLAELPYRIKSLKAKMYERDGNIIKIAYPLDLWEPNNVPQLLSGIAGNIFGMKAVKNLRLIDYEPPEEYVRNFKGPQYGIQGIRKLLKVDERPILATVPKPKIGFSAEEQAQVAYEIWTGGIDLLKDDENLSSLPFNKFEKRVEYAQKMREKVEAEIGERRSYLINITAETEEMKKRARFVADLNWEYVMIDIVTTGWAALQTLREVCEDLKLAIHAHRAMHATFTRNPQHGISMFALAKTARLIGVDQIHTGTVVGKLEGPEEEVTKINEFLRNDWYHIKQTFPVSSGGLHPGLLPEILKRFGSNLVIQVGGGVLGHPMGAQAGAKAVRQAIDAHLENMSLDEMAAKNIELKAALDKWGYLHPK